MEDPSIAAVVVATPSDTHFALARKSLVAGKHVYVEKPLARDVKQCDELDALANEANLVLMVGHLLLYHPAVNTLKELIASGELGELLFVRSDRMNFNQLRSHWNVLWDLAPHDLSMMSYLLDCDAPEVKRVGGWDTQEKKTAVLNDTQVEDKLALHSVTPSGRMLVEYPHYPDVEPLFLECEHFLQCLVTGERPRTDANNAYHSARPRLKTASSRRR
jgi:UDP-2-acetamido-3-amino-2,3-dideoxy-glucuronate N-acetyltransferase